MHAVISMLLVVVLMEVRMCVMFGCAFLVAVLLVLSSHHTY